MKEQLTAGLGERQVAELVEHQEVEAGQIISQTALATTAGLALQSVDKIDNGVKATPCTAADAGSRDGYDKMALASAGATDQYSVALLGKKATARQIAHQRLINRRAGEVEVVDVLGQRQLGNGQLVLDRARLLLSNLGAKQVADDAWRLVSTLEAGRHHLVIGRPHAVELERRHELENVGALHQEALRSVS